MVLKGMDKSLWVRIGISLAAVVLAMVLYGMKQETFKSHIPCDNATVEALQDVKSNLDDNVLRASVLYGSFKFLSSFEIDASIRIFGTGTGFSINPAKSIEAITSAFEKYVIVALASRLAVDVFEKLQKISWLAKHSLAFILLLVAVSLWMNGEFKDRIMALAMKIGVVTIAVVYIPAATICLMDSNEDNNKGLETKSGQTVLFDKDYEELVDTTINGSMSNFDDYSGINNSTKVGAKAIWPFSLFIKKNEISDLVEQMRENNLSKREYVSKAYKSFKSLKEAKQKKIFVKSIINETIKTALWHMALPLLGLWVLLKILAHNLGFKLEGLVDMYRRQKNLKKT